MAKIIIDEKEFQDQVDDYDTASNNVGAIKYTLDTYPSQLQSMDKYSQAIQEYNETMALLFQLTNKDLESMKQIKADWMHADSEIATKTIFDTARDWLIGKDE